MTPKASNPALVGSGGVRKADLAGASIAFQNSQSPKRPQASSTAQIIRLPIFRDGVFVCNQFVRIGPGLRARIREMAREARSR